MQRVVPSFFVSRITPVCSVNDHFRKVAFEGRFQYWSMEKLNKHTCVDCLTVSTKKLSNFRGQGQPGNITAVIDRHLLLQYLLKFRFDCPICEHLSNRNIWTVQIVYLQCIYQKVIILSPGHLIKVRKKIKNYAENFGSIMQKNVLIMQKKTLDNAEI